MLADIELAKLVHNNLTTARPVLRCILIRVNDGKVSLCGSLPSYYLRQLAVEQTKRIPGVRQIDDEISVKGH